MACIVVRRKSTPRATDSIARGEPFLQRPPTPQKPEILIMLKIWPFSTGRMRGEKVSRVPGCPRRSRRRPVTANCLPLRSTCRGPATLGNLANQGPRGSQPVAKLADLARQQSSLDDGAEDLAQLLVGEAVGASVCEHGKAQGFGSECDRHHDRRTPSKVDGSLRYQGAGRKTYVILEKTRSVETQDHTALAVGPTRLGKRRDHT